MTETTPQDREIDRLLGELNPIVASDLPSPSDSFSAQALYREITGKPLHPPTKRFRSRRFGVSVLVSMIGALSVGVGGAYAGLFGNNVTTNLSVLCYAAPSLNSRSVPVAATTQGPILSCTQAWNEGHVGTGPVPMLVACINHEGVAAVFPSAPGADVCSELELPALPISKDNPGGSTTSSTPTTVAPGSLTLGLRNTIVAQMHTQCFSAQVAQSTFTKLFEKSGVSWTVTVGSFPPGRPCASPAFDESDHRLILVGIPPLTTMTTS